MSAWVSPVCGLAFTMLSIFTASTRFSEVTGSPVNGDRSWGACNGADACPQAASSMVTTPASTIAAAALTVLSLIHLIASSRAAHLTRMHHHTSRYHNGLPGSSLTPRASEEPGRTARRRR